MKLLHIFNAKVDVINYDNDFLIIKSEDPAVLRKIGKAIFYKKFSFVDEVIITEVEICLKLNQDFDPSKIEWISKIEETENIEPQTFRLPVFFNDQKDWEAVQAHIGLSKNEIISGIEKTEFSIAMFGFLPGFLYLDGLDKRFNVPRKKVPSKYVKANSVAIGGQYLGVYSLDSPGGWNVIGCTPISVLQIPKLPPLNLNVEDKIVIQTIDERAYNFLIKKQVSLTEYNA